MNFFVIILCLISSEIKFLQADVIDDYINIFYDKILKEINFTSPCTEHIEQFYKAFNNREEWAVMMFDASSKPQSGILAGNIMHVGSYDECLKVDADSEVGRIRGQYCTAVLVEKQKGRLYTPGVEELKFSAGVCIPSSCRAEELMKIIETQENYVPSEYFVEFFEDFCMSEDKIIIYSAGEIFAIIMLMIVIMSTTYDVLIQQKGKGTKNELLTAFSFYTNGKKLFSTKTTDDNLQCLNGIRVISMMWIILAHGYMTNLFAPLINTLYFFEWKDQAENMFVPGATMGVDTFFAVSGLLVVYIFLKATAKGTKMNIPFFYLHRYLRLTPPLAALVLFYATLMRYTGEGPFWPTVYTYLENSCQTKWWATLLYIQNYYNPNTQCVGQCWYLAVDTQMYFLSPLILFPLIRWPKKTLAGILIVILISASGAFAVTWIKNYGPTYFDQLPGQNEDYFVATHFRMTAWLVGAIFGYIIYETKKKPIKLNKIQVLFLWCLSLTIMLAAVFGEVNFIKYEKDILESSIFNAFARPAWSFAICIITFLCIHGYGGIINWFLSHSIFTVLVRLNYSMYLLHQLIICYTVAQKRTPDYLYNLFLLHKFWGDFIFTLIASIIFTLTFESPIIILEKIIFKRTPKQKRETSNNLQSNLETNNGGVILKKHIKISPNDLY